MLNSFEAGSAPALSFPAPFDAIAETYDDRFSNSPIGRAQRASVWSETDRTFLPGQRILEINCGTGIDALHLANLGVHVLACDSSPRMIAVAQRRAAEMLGESLGFRCLPTEEIASLRGESLYDGVFSNFAGLNCVRNLHAVGRDLAPLVRRGGTAILCLFGRLCVWEIAFYLKRFDFSRAFRRFNRAGVLSTIASGSQVHVSYPSVRQLRRVFAPYFRLVRWKGVGILVPPSYGGQVAMRFPRALARAAEADLWLGKLPGARGLADHAVLTFERTDVQP
jgi:SAM-dependent methyltransferase